MLFSVCGKIMTHRYASTMENILAAGRMGWSAAPHSPLQDTGDRDTRGRIPPLNSTVVRCLLLGRRMVRGDGEVGTKASPTRKTS